ncbi:MAG: membrane protein insertase YidC [Bacteroidota bacterium]|nr:membrane protein insertase YidC [Bacteroidota bacterium]
MDKNVIIGFVLIGLVLMVWMWLNAPQPNALQNLQDTLSTQYQRNTIETIKEKKDQDYLTRKIQTGSQDTLGKYFSHLKKGEKKIIVIETKNYRAEIATNGAAIKSWILNKYLTWDKHPIDLINSPESGEFHLIFYTADGKVINTKDLIFEVNKSTKRLNSLLDGDSTKIEFVLNVSPQSRIFKTFIFYGDLYSCDISYRFEGMERIISNFAYQVTWESGIRYVEHNSVEESNSAKTFAYVGGELSELDATNFNEVVKDSNISGRVTWIATRNKYFTVAIVPRGKESKRAYLEGNRERLPDEGARENYNMALEMPFMGNSVESDRFTVYLGPIDLDIIKEYKIDLDKIMSLGAVWIIRPISEYFIIPLFKFLRMFIPNYGVVLIVFSIILKIILHPLTKASMKSMQKMQALQPMMTEIREKYKDDPQKMNQQVMRLYKEYGVNPAGGCLPLLLQLPILYALWSVFSSAIELRQASFVWWITDLSVPDVITKLPFRLPIFNINEISGLALLMGITMFIQQKMTVKDPRQKMMVWMMPILMTLLFNAFPSGLNLYYFVFNLLSIAQQAWINKKHKGEPLRKVEPKKSSGGWIAKIAKDLPTKPKR